MKKVLKPAVQEREEATFFCDITGKEMAKWGPAATLEVKGGYSSNRDGITYRLDLSEEGLDIVMKALKAALPPGAKMRDFAANEHWLSDNEIPIYDEDKI